MSEHVYVFVGGKAGRREVGGMHAVAKVRAGEWRESAEYPVEAGAVVVHEFEKVPPAS